MTSRMESVHTLISLPKPLDPGHGRTQLAAVSTFTKSRKRKRLEVCAAIDGECINIYNVETPALISSNAVSPQTRFLCPPCSVYLKSKSENSETRKTYVVTQDDSTETPSILSLEYKKVANEPSAPQQYQRSITHDSQILALESIRTSFSATTEDASLELLLITKNGSLDCFPADLGDPLWSARLESDEIDHASCVDAKSFIHGFLGNREDIAGRLRALAGNDEKRLETVTVICAIERSKPTNCLRISFTALRARNQVLLGFEQPTQELVTFQTPPLPPSQHSEELLDYSWNIRSGLLHVKSSTTISTLEFSRGMPKILSSISETSAPFSSHIAGPGSFIISIAETSLSLYDSKYSSIQDKQRLAFIGWNGSRKRKRNNDSAVAHPAWFVDYFPKLGMAVALHGHELVAVQLTPDSRTKRRKGHASTLLDSLGKGIAGAEPPGNCSYLISNDMGVSLMDRVDESWPERRALLFSLVEGGNIDAFDRSFAVEVGLEASESSSTEETLVPWHWEKSALERGSLEYRTKAFFALRAIFKLGDPDTTKEEGPKIGEASNLRIRFFPPNVFHWLVITGQLSTTLIEQAFRQFPESDDCLSIQKGDLIKSIAEFDPSLEILCSVVAHHPHLYIDDVAQCIRYIVRSYDNSTLPAPATLLASGDGNLDNGDINSAIEDEVESALNDVDMAITDLEEGHPMRGEALSRALTQLNGYSTLAIAEAFRRALSQHETVFLIHILRIELAEGGWTSRYVDSASTNADSGGPFNHSITVISRLISCAVDAIGITGWLTTSAIDPIDSVDELLSSLRAEISAALEGIHEATYMTGLLGEFMLYGTRYRDAQRAFGRKAIIAVKAALPGLPLGLKIEDQISLTKTEGGKVRERSKRDIGRQLNMKVPAYSFDRIRV